MLAKHGSWGGSTVVWGMLTRYNEERGGEKLVRVVNIVGSMSFFK